MKKQIKGILLPFFAIGVAVLSGCAAKVVEPYAIGGSRADATVEIAYDFGDFKLPPTKMEMDKLASRKCQVWGYDKAQAFGGQKRICHNNRCDYGQWVVAYQCLGSPK